MKANLFIVYTASDSFYDELTEKFQDMGIDEFVEYIREHHPEAVRQEPEYREVESDCVCEESEYYILTYYDNIEKTVNIYEKV